VKGHVEFHALCAGVPEGYGQFIETLVTMICFEIVYFGYPCGILSNVYGFVFDNASMGG